MTEQETKAQARKVLGLPVWAVAALVAVVLAVGGFFVYQAVKPGATSASGSASR
ncbi:hypothetical protein ACFQV2_02575 [Actinokineospora soli]|uniref:Uncharacterized protein n=1 Tax=Actinokineospora soli TaxID=1048753 RepID=A0ABW2THT0_9PSEU